MENVAGILVEKWKSTSNCVLCGHCLIYDVFPYYEGAVRPQDVFCGIYGMCPQEKAKVCRHFKRRG